MGPGEQVNEEVAAASSDEDSKVDAANTVTPDDTDEVDSSTEADSIKEEPPRAPDPRDLRIRLLEKQLTENEERLRDYIKAHKKAQSEFDSLRQRLSRDQEEQLDIAKGKVVERFLDVADNLDRSIQAARSGGTLASLLDGVELVHRMFGQALEELGLVKHDPLGEAFDPMSMEAHGMIPVSDPAQANTVMNTLRPGYRLKSRELRPALVQVGFHSG
jgi:molecular chaperone GrpE